VLVLRPGSGLPAGIGGPQLTRIRRTAPSGQPERRHSPAGLKTAKSAVELPGPRAGKVVPTFGGQRDSINVGGPLTVFEVPGNAAGIADTVPKDDAPKRRVRLSAVLDDED
jgi:pyruvate dehydrogenase E2 component (dihydrolipoamide acetyltransferase)